jgi:hypothetical protein
MGRTTTGAHPAGGLHAGKRQQNKRWCRCRYLELADLLRSEAQKSGQIVGHDTKVCVCSRKALRRFVRSDTLAQRFRLLEFRLDRLHTTRQLSAESHYLTLGCRAQNYRQPQLLAQPGV